LSDLDGAPIERGRSACFVESTKVLSRVAERGNQRYPKTVLGLTRFRIRVVVAGTTGGERRAANDARAENRRMAAPL
jgi:hypothetical protein